MFGKHAHYPAQRARNLKSASLLNCSFNIFAIHLEWTFPCISVIHLVVMCTWCVMVCDRQYRRIVHLHVLKKLTSWIDSLSTFNRGALSLGNILRPGILKKVLNPFFLKVKISSKLIGWYMYLSWEKIWGILNLKFYWYQ